MVNREHISLTANVAIRAQDRAKSDRRKVLWLAASALSGAIGIACGIAGLVLSFLAAEEIVAASSGVRLAVPILIVLSLSLLMWCAHCMDRLHQIRIGK